MQLGLAPSGLLLASYQRDGSKDYLRNGEVEE
jgi:hypothetical protein